MTVPGRDGGQNEAWYERLSWLQMSNVEIHALRYTVRELKWALDIGRDDAHSVHYDVLAIVSQLPKFEVTQLHLNLFKVHASGVSGDAKVSMTALEPGVVFHLPPPRAATGPVEAARRDVCTLQCYFCFCEFPFFLGNWFRSAQKPYLPWIQTPQPILQSAFAMKSDFGHLKIPNSHFGNRGI